MALPRALAKPSGEDFLNFGNLFGGGPRLEETQNVVDIFGFDLLVLPLHIHARGHWSVGAVDFVFRRLYYFDSLRMKTKQDDAVRFFREIRSYLKLEHRHKRGFDFPDLHQFRNCAYRGTPQQENAYDCGVFACLVAECLGDGRRFDFNQQAMQSYRTKIALQLNCGHID
eukprot:GHVT01066060.1.p1 GENE.GHVT01066060.1~~GHVT01066060.1.p1  ORF type:complete len:170 (-),score=36.07 GHVT01066060.1:481-990(-)